MPSNENSAWYVGNSDGSQLMEKVKASGVVDVEAAVKPEKFKEEALEEVKSCMETRIKYIISF